MSVSKWALMVLAVLAGIAAGLAALPYGWAHIASYAISAASGAYMSAAGYVIHVSTRAVKGQGNVG